MAGEVPLSAGYHVFSPVLASSELPRYDNLDGSAPEETISTYQIAQENYQFPSSAFNVGDYISLLNKRRRLEPPKPVSREQLHPHVPPVSPLHSTQFDRPLNIGAWATPLLQPPRRRESHNGVLNEPRMYIPPFFDSLPFRDKMRADIEEEVRAKPKVKKEKNPIKSRSLSEIILNDLEPVHIQFTASHLVKRQFAHQIARQCQQSVRNRAIRMFNYQLQDPGFSKKLTKEMQSYWRVRGKAEAQALKQADREAREQMKREMDRRDAKSQQAKLNFLLTQSEIFVHFMSKKMSAPAAAAQPNSTMDLTQRSGKADIAGVVNAGAEEVKKLHDVLEAGELVGPEAELVIDADGDHVETDQSLKTRAIHDAAAAIKKVEATTRSFDADVQMRKQIVDESLDDIAQRLDETDLLHPSTMPEQADFVDQPKLLTAHLKSYQLKGLNWLANLYDLGINGILADEMGLGKTITCISLMAYLAEVKNVWGPFLILAPASTLHHWREELNRFCPSMKVLPYWGHKDDREVLRMYWKDELLLTKDASFHVCVTSYQLVVRDVKFFQRCPWQYLVLDEAQAIKSYKSQRWLFLKGLKVRARLLMTGTPIQNSMAELWALLNFIMPQLFDDHREFNEWFSKDIEQHVSDDAELNQHQLSRLHTILKPFMLRRIKLDVENELPKKTELDIPIDLTPHQRDLYSAIRARISIADIVESKWTDEKQQTLMNLIMQLRKVCNHPLLFERKLISTSFVFNASTVVNAGSWIPEKRRTVQDQLELLEVIVPLNRSALQYELPRIIIDDRPDSSEAMEWTNWGLAKWKWMFQASVIPHSLVGLSHAEFEFIRRAPELIRLAVLRGLRQKRAPLIVPLASDELRVSVCVSEGMRRVQRLGAYLSAVVATPIDLVVHGSRWFQSRRMMAERSVWEKRLITGPILSYVHEYSAPLPYSTMPASFHVPELGAGLGRAARFASVQQAMRGGDGDLAPGLVGSDRWLVAGGQGAMHGLGSCIVVSPPDALVNDSGKMVALDKLLRQLKAEGHRCLIYSQMVKVLDILESFMRYRHYTFLRLDGSTSIADRRVRVDGFQNNPNIFVFLLSTRAAGLGLNLVAADTVIFFESDWNPTVDHQAMDRVHRLGQTKPVTIYRLVAQNSIEERILVRAKEKADIQNIIISGGQFKPDDFKQHEVVSLLVDDDEVNRIMEEKRKEGEKRKRKM